MFRPAKSKVSISTNPPRGLFFQNRLRTNFIASVFVETGSGVVSAAEVAEVTVSVGGGGHPVLAETKVAVAGDERGYAVAAAVLSSAVEEVAGEGHAMTEVAGVVIMTVDAGDDRAKVSVVVTEVTRGAE